MLAAADLVDLLADELAAWVDGDLPCRLSLRAFSMVRFSGIPSSIHPAVNDNVRTGRWFGGERTADGYDVSLPLSLICRRSCAANER